MRGRRSVEQSMTDIAINCIGVKNFIIDLIKCIRLMWYEYMATYFQQLIILFYTFIQNTMPFVANNLTDINVQKI